MQFDLPTLPDETVAERKVTLGLADVAHPAVVVILRGKAEDICEEEVEDIVCCGRRLANSKQQVAVADAVVATLRLQHFTVLSLA